MADKRIYNIISSIANSDKSGAIASFKAVFEDRVAEKVRNFVSNKRITPNA